MRRLTLTTIVLAALFAPASAQHAGHGGHGAPGLPTAPQPYAGQQSRALSMLSDTEIKGYLAGEGMGLARSAELNGYPGPAHILELDQDLGLTDAQRARVKAAFDAVKGKLRVLGARYVEAEQAVDAAFRAKAPAKTLAARVSMANKLLGEIRMAHLTAHIEVTPVLTEAQRYKYAALRGYGTDGAAHHGKH